MMSRLAVAVLSVASMTACASMPKVRHVTKGGATLTSHAVFYALPRAVVGTEFTVQRSVTAPGRCAPYRDLSAEVFVAEDDVVQQASAAFKTRDYRTSQHSEPDPDQVYAIEVKGHFLERNSQTIELTDSGFLTSGSAESSSQVVELVTSAVSAATGIAGSLAKFGDAGASKSGRKSVGDDEALEYKYCLAQATAVEGIRERRMAIIGGTVVALSGGLPKDTLELLLSNLASSEEAAMGAFAGVETVTTGQIRCEIAPPAGDATGKKPRTLLFFSPDFGVVAFTDACLVPKTLQAASNGAVFQGVIADELTKVFDWWSIWRAFNAKPSPPTTTLEAFLEMQEMTHQPGGRAIGVAAVNATAGAIWKKVTEKYLTTLRTELLGGRAPKDAVKTAFAAVSADVTLDAAAKKEILDGIYAELMPQFVNPSSASLEAKAKAEFEQLIERELFAKVAGPTPKPVEEALGSMRIDLLDIVLDPLTINASMLPGTARTRHDGEGLVYRVPGRARMTVSLANDVKIDSLPVIPQFGSLVALPGDDDFNALEAKVDAYFYADSGALKQLKTNSKSFDPAAIEKVGGSVSGLIDTLDAEKEKKKTEAKDREAANDELAVLERRRKILEEQKKIKDLERELGSEKVGSTSPTPPEL